jgi:hypothetical protein
VKETKHAYHSPAIRQLRAQHLEKQLQEAQTAGFDGRTAHMTDRAAGGIDLIQGSQLGRGRVHG